MSVIISNGNTSLNTASGFYRVEAYNMGGFSSTVLDIQTSRTIPITFANSGNSQGVVIPLSGSATVNYGVIVTLQETKTPVTITIATPGVVNFTSHGLLANQAFEFATTGALPTGITAGTTYYVSATGLGANSFQFSTTPGGASVNLSGTQSGTQSIWVDRATVTKTTAQITNNVTNPNSSSWTYPFMWTSPYAVDTAANKWRIKIARGTGSAGSWSIRTSDATNPTYAAWCDNALTFTNNDTIICKDVVTIDKTATIRGVLGTGDTTRSVAALLCTMSTPTPDSVANLVWQNPPSSSYTLTIDGLVVESAHSGFRAGTSTSRISTANQAIITVQQVPTFGSASNSGFGDYDTSNAQARKKSFFLYGEIPTIERTTLSADACIGQTATFTIATPCVGSMTAHQLSDGTPIRFTTTGALPTGIVADTTYYTRSTGTVTPANNFWLYDTQAHALAGGATGQINTSGTQSGTHTSKSVLLVNDTTGWSIGDEIYVGRAKLTGLGEAPTRTISTISGKEITLSTNLLTAARAVNASVVRTNGYGIKMQSSTTTAIINNIYLPSNFNIEGVQFINIRLTNNSTAATSLDDSANRSLMTVSHCSIFFTISNSFLITFCANENGASISYCNCIKGIIIGSMGYSVSALNGKTLAVNITDNVNLNNSTTATMAVGTSNAVFSRNTFENSSTVSQYMTFNGINLTIDSNVFWGNPTSSSTAGSIVIGTVINSIFSNNKYDWNSLSMIFNGTQIGTEFNNELFGTIKPNTTDIDFSTSNYGLPLFNNPTSNPIISTTNLGDTAPGTHLKIVNYNGVTNDDRGYLTYGKFQRVGDGLSDTIVHTAGTAMFGIRFESLSSINRLEWTQNVPTGNIINKQMMVGVWVKLNSVNYYAGVNQMPRITVDYDNGTIAYAEAAQQTDWQFIFVAFTPITSYGEIIVTISTMTDATTTNAYIYWDDFVVLYPAGYRLDLGTIDLWAQALPVTPTIATVNSGLDVWAANTSAMTGSGTIGKYVSRKLLNIPKFLGLK